MFPASLDTRPRMSWSRFGMKTRYDDSISLASELRGLGLRVELYPEADKLGKQFKYASAREIPFVARDW